MASTRNYHKGPKQNKDTARSAIQERTEEPSQRRDSTSEYALHASTREERPTTQDVWIIDSACTSHMTSHGEWIEHKTEERRSIQVAEEGRHIESASSGSIQATVQATHVPSEHCLISKDNSRTAWHRRLGHPSDNKLDLILKNNLLKGLNSINGTLDQCDACSLGKMTKVPYVHTDGNQESYPFEAIYVDLCGPMRINSLGGNNGTEFINKNLETFIESKGIKHELTTPYTPRSNGRVERANRTLLDKGRTLLADSQLPLHFWAEAVNTAAYLYNLTPTTNDPDTTPMEKWKGKKPSVSHIMRFGCEVFYKLENHQRHKLEAKSKRGIFVGYSRYRRAYRVFDITARVILETADIHFRENNNVISEEKQNDNNTDTDTYFFIQEDEQLDNHVLSDVDIEEPAPDTMINRQTESSESDRPQRTRTIPKRFDDYVLATTNETIPKDYNEAIACQDKKHWENAMLEEIQNMYSHQVWELVPRPVNAKVVKSKWVFKISKDQENKTYKARLVAMGYNQIPGRDYNESFSPVIKNATLRTILSMAATKDSVIKLFDVKAAYLNGNIENTIFMEQPAGFVQDRNRVCKLNKSIYGLPQSGRSWYEKFSQVLHDCGLEKLKSDPCLFKWKNEDKYFYVGIYVDDFITVSDSEDTSNRFINKLRHHLEIKDVTCKGMFLGIKIIQDKEGISLQQSHYVQQILQKYGMENCKEVPTPGSKEINLDNHIEDDNCEQHTYQEALGMLMFLAVNTRPDIAYITSKLSQYSRQPKQMHWTAIKRVMRYLRGTIDLGVKFERGKTGILKSYADASWSTTHDGKSYGGYVLKLGEATIDWKSSKQPLVALSTMEAEMIAACESCCQIKWIINLLRELEEWNFMEKPTAIYTDSQSLINWISSPKQSSRCRHINRKYHFLRDCFESRDICLLYKPSQDLEADIFTKDLSRDQMKKHLESLSIVCQAIGEAIFLSVPIALGFSMLTDCAKPEDRIFEDCVHSLRVKPLFCGALRWKDESSGMCCSNGKVRLPLIDLPPEPLRSLLSGENSDSVHFLRNIRKYNYCFQMTSFGAENQTHSVTFPTTFSIQGQVYHRIGSLMPSENQPSRFLQIYFMGNDDDDDIQTDRRCQQIQGVRRNIAQGFQRMLHQHNLLVQQFKTALENLPSDAYRVVVNADRTPPGQHPRRYNAPTADEVAVVLAGNQFGSRDIVLHQRDNLLQHVSDTHRFYDALQYPLIFWKGQEGYYFHIPQIDPNTS
ncbi:hypothetical protein LAZ67_19001950 [Cordylochernes scorpioides]|uniref:Integrase catalytic domain-containing protein n=1 Tax=Cordylochernes scorpioides TaxID=51811 RepID=A0ABY6LI27_9ARAC|nr:hypothetical protein LAZ67_19001950 [Cordylochernes scorpioides]